MTPDQIALVKHSFDNLKPFDLRAADVFYDYIFDNAPAIREMFPIDTSEQKQKLIQTLSTVTQYLHRPEILLPIVEELGRIHKDYGVIAEHFPLVGEALINAFDEVQGDAFTDDMREAWEEAYSLLSSTMIKAMQ